MHLVIYDTYSELSDAAAEWLTKTAEEYESPVICPASGNTPLGLYRSLVRRSKEGSAYTGNWTFIGLDEWMGMNGSDSGSCRHTLDLELFFPLNSKSSNIHFFDGRTEDPAFECSRMDRIITAHGGLNIVVLGLGMNGHIGFNEPGVSENIRSHLINLDEITQQAGQKYFNEEKSLKQGITIGLQTLKEAGSIILLVSGSSKAGILKKVLEGPVTNEVPASLLRDHPALFVYADKEAAHLLTQ